jgi:hypothetical protein
MEHREVAMTALVSYFKEHVNALRDPLFPEARLAGKADNPFIFYEREEQFLFRSGGIFELEMSHLIVPERDVRIGAGSAQLRAIHREDLTTMRDALAESPSTLTNLLQELDITGADGDRYRCIADRRASSGHPVKDPSLRAELLGDPKEVFERAGSVQVTQEELRADAGSVRMTEFMAIEGTGQRSAPDFPSQRPTRTGS